MPWRGCGLPRWRAGGEVQVGYMVPQWLQSTGREEMVRWLRDRYEHVPTRADGETVSPHYKFPKEKKPSLPSVMRDSAILLKAAVELNEVPVGFVEDAAFYFNQAGYAPEELWKSNLAVLSREGDDDGTGAAIPPGQLMYVHESRLGFGSYASSNIMQRFSNALVGWTLAEFDRLEAEALANEPEDSAWRRWVEKRRPLEARCRQERPKRRGRALSDCTQTRLAVIHMYTDDPAALTVGVARTMRLLQAWHTITRGLRVKMAGADKRQLGASLDWIGVTLMVGIGLVVVPRAKLIRARDALRRAKRGDITFSEYRALVGLLEHLRFIARLSAIFTNALYAPHGANGASKDGPSATVRPDEMMETTIDKWLEVIMYCAGALVTLVFSADGEERLRAARTILAGSSDAAGDGEGEPGFGGYLHGFYWRFALTPKVLALLHITGWETLAKAVNTLVADRLGGPGATLSMRGDALLSAHVISNERAGSADVRTVVQALVAAPGYADDVAERVVYEHLSGDMNVPSDYVSRALWTQLRAVTGVLRVRAVPLALGCREQDLIRNFLDAVARRKGLGLPSCEIEEALTTPPFDIGGEGVWHSERRPQPVRREDLRAALQRRAGKRELPQDEVVLSHASPRGVEECTHANKRQATKTSFEPPRETGLARQRSLTPAERGTGKGRRDTAEGDGPPFRPSWARGDAHADGIANEPKLGTTALGQQPNRFRPRWAGQPKKQGGTPYVRPALRKSDAKPSVDNPYEQLAYRESKMLDEDRDDVACFVERLVNDRSPGRIGAPAAEIKEMAMAVAEAKADGINPRTGSKDALAWREWLTFSKLKNFDPRLRSEWTRRFPERESLKFASFLLFRSQRMRGRAREHAFAKPMSVYQSYLALRRVFGRRRTEIPPSTEVRQSLRGLVKRFARKYGIERMRPQRVEPVTPWITDRCVVLAEKGTAVINGVQWCLATSWTCFIVTAWMIINLQVGSRKGESTKLAGDVDENDWWMRGRRASVVDGAGRA